jgi:hypothetical protein
MRFEKFVGSSGWPRATRIALGLVCAAGLGVAGCEEGKPPYSVIDGDRPDYLPPGAIELGSRPDLGELYVFDGALYRTYPPPVGVDSRFVKRGEVLGPLDATNDELLRPDLVDDTLAMVYANPKLLGFQRAALGSPPGFVLGSAIGPATDFFPLANDRGASLWRYNHDTLTWSRSDTLIGQDVAPPSQNVAAPVWRIQSRNVARTDLRFTYKPTPYSFEQLWSATADGIFMHAFHIVSERVELIPPEEFRPPEPQRNPRMLWLPIGSLGTPDPNQPIPTSIDQCLDGMWGTLDLFPVQLTEGDLQVGQKRTTWTYLSVDPDSLQHRLLYGNELEQLRCAGTGIEDVPVFPTGQFSLLARYESVVEDALDFYELKGGQAGTNAVVGVYGTEDDGVLDIVRLVVTMYLGAPVETPVQRLELYLQRDIGLVVQFSGIFADTRSKTRLRSCVVNGTVYDEAYFSYAD